MDSCFRRNDISLAEMTKNNVQLKSFTIREKVIKSIREFFYRKGFHEVIIPIFNTSLPLEPNIYAFEAGEYYLPTSPEATLKKAIAKGCGNCFAIGLAFRDMEDTSPIHRPEFLMLEWYRENADYKNIMEECRELIVFIFLSLRGVKRRGNLSIHMSSHSREIPRFARNDTENKWPLLSLVDLFRKYANLDLAEIIDERKMILVAKKRGYKLKGSTWEQLFNQIFLNEIELHLPKDPFFLTDYPARISPLCAKRADRPYLAERFELYIAGIEVGNGNTENTDADEVFNSMKEEEKYRKKENLICPPIDMDFIEALEKMHGKKYAGIGLGVERLTMVVSGVKDIGELEMSSRT